jgi:hypothetical protein
MTITRREFSKLIAFAALARAVTNAETNSAGIGMRSRIWVEAYNYSGVRLLEGLLKQQFQASRDTL